MDSPHGGGCLSPLSAATEGLFCAAVIGGLVAIVGFQVACADVVVVLGRWAAGPHVGRLVAPSATDAGPFLSLALGESGGDLFVGRRSEYFSPLRIKCIGSIHIRLGTQSYLPVVKIEKQICRGDRTIVHMRRSRKKATRVTLQYPRR